MVGVRLTKNMIFLVLFLFFVVFSGPVQAAGPEIEAESAVLINARTGEVLWEKDAYRIMHPASTTKILTAVLLLEYAQANEVVRTSKRASETPGSSLYLSEGQQLTVNDILHGVMLHSANDASVVAAEHLAGSVDVFAVMMNQKAKQVGALQSNFTNPHGLTDSRHLTTAYDLAMIARHAMQNPRFRELSSTNRYTMSWLDGETRTIHNKNPMLSGYDGMLGIKAGYTTAARRTFVGAAERDGLELVVVVLRSVGNEVWTDTEKILDYGFRTFTVLRPFSKDEILGSAPIRFGEAVLVRAAEDFELTRKVGSVDIAWDLEFLSGKSAPVAEGDVLGSAIVYADGVEIGTVHLLAAESVARAALATGRFWFLSVLLMVSGLRARKVIRRRRKRRKIIRRKKDSRHIARKFR
jgi:D-alanyl-D-alanine carboxypeptidase (penicillin-binding protein 5/6)